MAPSFATSHRFCASHDGPRKFGFCWWCLLKLRYFAPFVTTREKQILARVIGIQKEN